MIQCCDHCSAGLIPGLELPHAMGLVGSEVTGWFLGISVINSLFSTGLGSMC